MKPTFRLTLLALIILIFAAAPAVHAVEPTADGFSAAVLLVCGESPATYTGSIDTAKEVDYYSIDLVADQRLTIDVDTADNGKTLDTILEVFDGNGEPLAANDRSSEVPLNEDPYLEITVEVGGTYYFAISDSTSNGITGDYTLLFQCSDPSIPPDPVEPVKIGDLLGATGSDPGSLLSINPADGASTVRFPFKYGEIADVEFDPGSKMLFVATDGSPGNIIVVDPNTGAKVRSFSYDEGGFLALESAENILFGIYVDGSEQYSLVTIDQTTGATSPVAPSSTVPPVRSLAYHPGEKVLYGASGADLIKFDVTSSAVEIQKVASPGLGQIVAVDFSHENVLYCVDISGNLFRIPDLTLASELPVKVGSIIAASEVATVASTTSKAPVSGLTFVVGEAPPDEEPIKTICSSSFTSPESTGSELANHKFKRFNLTRNPLHRGIGMFKFQGKYGETLTLGIDPENSEPVEAEEDSKTSWLKKLWSKCREKERLFVSIRDAIPGVKFRAKNKGTLPLEWTVEQPLPADGWYYIMVIRPLPRFQDVDYCLSLESDAQDSQAWQSLDVVWPGDDAEEVSTTTSTEAKTTEVQSDEVSVEESSGLENENTTPGATTGLVPTPTGSEPVSLAPDSSVVGPVDEVSSQEVQAETTIDKTGEVVAPAEEPAIEPTVEPSGKMGTAPSIVEETTLNETGEVVAPAEEPAIEPTVEPSGKMGTAPSIVEETTLNETGEVVAPAEELATEATEEPVVKGAPPAD